MPRFIYTAQHPPPRCPRHGIPPSLCRQCRIVDVKSPLCGSILRLRKFQVHIGRARFLRVQPDEREEFAAYLLSRRITRLSETRREIRPRKSDSERTAHVVGIIISRQFSNVLPFALCDRLSLIS